MTYPALTYFCAALVCLTATPARAADNLILAKDGSGVCGYNDTPVQPWSGFRVHDADRPRPLRVETGTTLAVAPASGDAIVLFEGKGLDRWQSNDWRVVDRTLEAVSGDLRTKEAFGDCQIHLEWMMPTNFNGHPFDRGNNGVYLMGLFEIQIFDSFNEKLYPDGQAAAVYGQTPPRVNVCRPPGVWQSYDIFFTAAKFEGTKLLQPAHVTVVHNGVLVHHYQEIYGETQHRRLPEYKQRVSTGPLVLSSHNCPVRFRNIWLRRM